MHMENNLDRFSVKKPPYDSVNKVLPTYMGRLHIRGPVNPERLSGYNLLGGLCCFRPCNKQHQALLELANSPDGMVFVAAYANTIVSYVCFQKPDYPWWQKRCFPQLLELGSIETDPSWRKIGLTKTVLETIFNDDNFDYFEDFIVIAVQTVDIWDFKNTNLSPWEYRRLLLNLFQKCSFTSWETEDPEIREHPSNILMARIGSNIEEKFRKHFYNCCLGTD